jgi:hypothetical protein
MRTTAVAALCLVTTLAACGDADVRPAQSPHARTYDGPLHVERGDARHPRAGAAGNVVDCETWGAGGSSGEATYSEGATARSAAGALEVARSEAAFGGVQEGLSTAKEEDDRVLYVVEVGGVVKQAVIVRDGPATEGAGGPGWYVESWAHCDEAELPRSFTDSIGLQIWTGADGRPAVEYDAPAELPEVAVDTGYERDGDHLWLSPDQRRAYVGTAADVEVWPRTVEPLGCA